MHEIYDRIFHDSLKKTQIVQKGIFKRLKPIKIDEYIILTFLC